jgi:putative SOS response-associated peptidase YedK
VCGRTTLVEARLIREAFDITEMPDDPLLATPRYNIAPSQPIATIRVPHRLELLRWGIFRKERAPLQINAKAETLAKTINRQRRCLVPADGFYEWRPSDRQAFWFHMPDRHLFAFAGVWKSTTTSDGEVVESVAIMTCAPLPPVAAVHDRMPLVLPREGYARWLDASADVSDLLHVTTSQLVATPVSSFVNSPKNDGPMCIEPGEVPQGTLFGS